MPGTSVFELDDRRAARGNQRGLHVMVHEVPPSKRTLSKISPITWKLDTRFGPPLPTNSRTVSPTFTVSALVAQSASPPRR